MTTALDILVKQDEVSDLEAKQQKAWHEISRAEAEVDKARRRYEDARWSAEYAREELKKMVEAVRNA